MRIGRTLPPAAAPLGVRDLVDGLVGLFRRTAAMREVEESLRAFFGVRHVFLVSSGKAALVQVLRALRALSPRDEVVVPAYTCFSVPSAVVKAGLRVVPCDIDPLTLDFDPDGLRGVLGPRTLCVVANHLFGQPADVERLKALCEPLGIAVVEDAAQALGSLDGGRLCGTRGDVAILSFGRGKNVTAVSGGAIVTDSDRIGAVLRETHGQLGVPGLATALKHLLEAVALAILLRPSLYWVPAALPWLRLGETIFHERFPVTQLSGVQAGLLRRWQERLVTANRRRAAHASRLLGRLGLGTGETVDAPFPRLPFLAESAAARAEIQRAARRHGLGVVPMYPSPISDIPQLGGTWAPTAFPGARRVAETLLTLPTHPLLSSSDLRRLEALLELPAFRGARVPAGRMRQDQRPPAAESRIRARASA